MDTKAAAIDTVPLVVDLDRSLLRSDLISESLAVLARQRPLALFGLARSLLRGRAAFKHRLARLAMPDVQTLPYRREILDYLQQQKSRGRRLILATAADAGCAERVARHLGLFDEVYSSDGLSNLGGTAKQRLLVARFGERGYDYLGDSRRDMPVWRSARQALVAGSEALARRVAQEVPLERRFRDAQGGLPDYLQALRPQQWVKNLLVFVPLFAAHRLGEYALLVKASLAFLAFSLCAASVYLLNDLLDLPADRRHPYKRERALASGRMGIGAAAALMSLLLAAALAVSLTLHPAAALVLGSYYLANLAYSLGLKERPVLDVLILAAGYAARVALGAIASGIRLSPWLLGFCMFLFFSLALVKRYAELVVLKPRDGPRTHARGYVLDDMGVIAAQGIGSGYVAVLILALYMAIPAVEERPPPDPLLWLLCPLLLYWISYLWLMADRGRIDKDPVSFALEDKTSRVIMIAIALTALVTT